MAKLDSPKRIIKEDFEEDYQEMIDKLAFIQNTFNEQVYQAFNKSINNDNLSREFVTITVENGGGNLKMPTQFKIGLSKIIGMNTIRAENLTNLAVYPTSIPFLTWTLNGNIITVKNVSGIQDNNKYRLTLEVIS